MILNEVWVILGEKEIKKITFICSDDIRRVCVDYEKYLTAVIIFYRSYVAERFDDDPHDDSYWMDT